MRECLRCGTPMEENVYAKVHGFADSVGVDICRDEGKLFSIKLGRLQVAHCPNCGEVSFYLKEK